jgi:hypothetical protein
MTAIRLACLGLGSVPKVVSVRSWSLLFSIMSSQNVQTTDPCKKLACEIQTCLQLNSYRFNSFDSQF